MTSIESVFKTHGHCGSIEFGETIEKLKHNFQLHILRSVLSTWKPLSPSFFSLLALPLPWRKLLFRPGNYAANSSSLGYSTNVNVSSCSGRNSVFWIPSVGAWAKQTGLHSWKFADLSTPLRKRSGKRLAWGFPVCRSMGNRRRSIQWGN